MSDEVQPPEEHVVEGVPLDLVPPPKEPPKPPTAQSASPETPKGWSPKLNKKQRLAFEDCAKYVLIHAERFTGKTICALMALIHHCVHEKDALAIIITPHKRQGIEGMLTDLLWCLDIWQNGNWKTKNQEDGREDSGIGLHYTEPTEDTATKDKLVWISNRHGGWSKVILISIPQANMIQKRMRGLSPSFVYEDEITMMNGPEYFVDVIVQLSRRRGIKLQQFYASCNPDGPRHWVYQTFFVDCVNPDTGARKPTYSVHHLPLVENLANIDETYLDTLHEIKDPIEKRRQLFGEWVDRPTGEAIFRLYYHEENVVRPPPKSEQYIQGFGLLPNEGFPIWVGMDPGPANFSVVYLQMIPTKSKSIWLAFDEQIYVGKYAPDFVVVKEVLQKMDDWNAYLNGTAQFIHVGDEAAITHMKPEGSYDATKLHKLSGGRIKLRASPGHKDSRVARVKMCNSLFLTDSVFISAKCEKLRESLNMLESEKAKEGKYDNEAGLRPKRSRYIHPWDAFTYPIYLAQVQPNLIALRSGNVDPDNWVFRAGSGR